MEVARAHLDLKAQNLNQRAQCFVIDASLDDSTNQISATVLVKNGILRHEDIFVCGTEEGRVRIMRDDRGQQVNEAFPG